MFIVDSDLWVVFVWFPNLEQEDNNNETKSISIHRIVQLPNCTDTKRENPSIHSVSKDLLLVNDGSGHYYLVQFDYASKTGRFLSNIDFQNNDVDVPNGPEYEYHHHLPMVICDVKYYEPENEILVFGYDTAEHLVQERTGHAISSHRVTQPETTRKTVFIARLVSITQSDENARGFKASVSATLLGHEAPFVSVIDVRTKSVVIGAEHAYTVLTAQDEKMEAQVEKEAEAAAESKDAETSNPTKNLVEYAWSQTESTELSIHIKLPTIINKKDVICKFERQRIYLSVNMGPSAPTLEIFNQKPFDEIVPSESYLTIERGELITLYITKPDHGCRWMHLWEEDDGVEETVDRNDLALFIGKLDKFTASDNDDTREFERPMFGMQDTLMTSRVEECDMEGQGVYFVRVDTQTFTTPVITEIAPFSNHEWICPGIQTPISAPFCIKYDVDGLIYEPIISIEGKLELNHVATLNAFSFISASKRDRRLMTFGPNYDYGIIVESKRNMYVYRQPEEERGKFGVQNIVEIGEAPVVGVQIVGNRGVVVLKEDAVMLIML